MLSYCGRGSLEGVLKDEGTRGSWEELRHSLVLDVARGLKFLHHDLSPALIHRDVKPANILVSSGTCVVHAALWAHASWFVSLQ